MCDYWANFIKTGDPNGFDLNGSRLPEWKPYTDADRNEMLFTSDGAQAATENNRFLRFLLGELK
jgi:para-nitrobenzyl esterase